MMHNLDATLRQRCSHLLWFLCLAGAASSFAAAQAIATASSSGVSLHAGGGYSYFQADYGKRALGGYTIFADYNRTPRWGIEFQVRALRFNQEFGTHQTTLLIGPRYVYRRPRYQAFAKLLVGEGKFHFPYNYAEGTYFVVAPGGGIDIPVRESRFTIRAAEIEYQTWPQFSFGGLNPYGFSAGISYRILDSAQGR